MLLRFMIAAMLLWLVASCGGDDGDKKCSLIACASGIRLTLKGEDGEPLSSFSGTALIADAEIPFACPEDPNCAGNGQVFFEGATPSEIRVMALAGAARVDDEVTVSVATEAPNGPDCETCDVGSATVVLR